MGRERSSSRRAGMRQDRRRVAQVGLDRRRVGHFVPVQELPAVAHRDGIGIHVDDAGQGVDRLGQRVDVADGGQARADVEELVDARLGQDGDSAAQEGAIDARSGTVVRTISVGASVNELALDTRTGHLFVAMEGTDKHSLVPITGGAGVVSTVDARSGKGEI